MEALLITVEEARSVCGRRGREWVYARIADGSFESAKSCHTHFDQDMQQHKHSSKIKKAFVDQDEPPVQQVHPARSSQLAAKTYVPKLQETV